MKLTALVFTPICVAFYPHQDQGLARGEALTLYSQLCITAARPEHAEEQGSSPGVLTHPVSGMDGGML